MKKFLIQILILSCFAIINHIYSQALYPVKMNEKVLNSSIIIEAKVLGQNSFWNPGHTMIYTSNKIEVYKTFKGTLPSGNIEIMTIGGAVGLESIEASDLLTLQKDDIGLFFCYPNSIGLISPFTGNQLFDVYSSGQGCFTYNLETKTASAPFVRYASIENELYRELVKMTGHQPVIVNPSFNLSAQARPLSPLTPVITSFSPHMVNAGATQDPANNLLTINGSGFGDTPTDQSAVLFDDPNDGDGGTPFRVPFNSPLMQSWTDNQIMIRVPGRAGTGTFQVMDSTAVLATSPEVLNVGYSVLTGQFTSGGATVIKEPNLMNVNGSGGYTVHYSTATGGGGVNLDASPEKQTFQRALNTWEEIAGLNFIEGSTTVSQAVTNNAENIIMFDNTNTGTTPLASGVLAVCFFYADICPQGTTNEPQRTGFDIVIRNGGVSTGSNDFTSGPCPPSTANSEIDLENVLLHELGHALNLGHVNDDAEGAFYPDMNPGKLMNFSVSGGLTRKSPDFSAYAGALYCINPQSNMYGSCSLSGIEMVPLARAVVAEDECPVSFPVISTPLGTMVNFDLVHTTSNKFTDPAFNSINCAGTGTGVTNNAYYAIRSDDNGGNLSIAVSNYSTVPASVQGSCPGVGVRLTLFQVNSCPAGQLFPPPLACRTITRNGSLAAITGLAPNTNYLIYLDGMLNTKANFTLTLNGSVLPIALLDFKGNISNGKVSLSWKTTREINSKEFSVEKSFDGAVFSQFTLITAKGSSDNENNYGATDDRPYSGYTFYRLKMVDKDGHFQYSVIVKIRTPKKAVQISRIFPNPTSGKLNFQLVSDSRQSLVIEIFDLPGKKVASFNLSVEQGFNERPVIVKALASGSYFIQVKDATGSAIEKSKFIKE